MDRTKLTVIIKTFSPVLFYLLLAVIAFGLLIRSLGYYWDDWPSAWFFHAYGSDGYRTVFQADRPLLGLLYSITTPFIGSSPLRWHAFALLTRWLCASLFWLTVLSIWPKYKWQAAIAGLLFLVYPGFSQQPIAITYSHVWLLMAIFLISLISMSWAIRRKRWYWLLIISSWILTAFSLFTVEYFFGLELIRLYIIWLIISETTTSQREKLKKSMLQWLPYFLILIGFLLWRLVLTETPRGDVILLDSFRAAPAQTILELLDTIIASISVSSFSAWGAIFDYKSWLSFTTFFDNGPILTVLFTILITASFLYFYYKSVNKPTTATTNTRVWRIQVFLLGGLALLVGGIPFWLTDLPIRLSFPWDRFTIPMMFGVSLLFTLMIDILNLHRRAQIITLSIIVGLAVGIHYDNITDYINNWRIQKEFFWQLSWRAPQIEPGTLLLTDSWPFNRSTDNSLTATLNWTYAPEHETTNIPYLVYDIPSRLGITLPSLTPDQQINENYRIATFDGSTSQALVFYYEPPACLRILDPNVDQSIFRYPNTLNQALDLSRLELIDSTPEAPAQPPSIFGSEITRDWCYYYEKADLANYLREYPKVVALGDEAFDKGYFPRDPHEYLPFIEAYAHEDRWNKALNFTTRAYQESYLTKTALCEIWKRIDLQLPDSLEKQETIQQIESKINCQAP